MRQLRGQMRLGLAALIVLAGAGHAFGQTGTAAETMLMARLTCKQMRTCEDAVILWCNGYRRADGDNDGIPCENVCGSKREVDAIRAAIGC